MNLGAEGDRVTVLVLKRLKTILLSRRKHHARSPKSIGVIAHALLKRAQHPEFLAHPHEGIDSGATQQEIALGRTLHRARDRPRRRVQGLGPYDDRSLNSGNGANAPRQGDDVLFLHIPS